MAAQRILAGQSQVQREWLAYIKDCTPHSDLGVPECRLLLDHTLAFYGRESVPLMPGDIPAGGEARTLWTP